jgi:hypothetical protein
MAPEKGTPRGEPSQDTNGRAMFGPGREWAFRLQYKSSVRKARAQRTAERR